MNVKLLLSIFNYFKLDQSQVDSDLFVMVNLVWKRNAMKLIWKKNELYIAVSMVSR